MPVDEFKAWLRKLYSWLGRVGVAFFVALAATQLAPPGLWRLGFQIAASVLALWLLIRLMRWGARGAIWRLRNRLLVTYTFIAVVPLLLVLTLVALSAYAILSQVAIHLAASELDRRVELLTSMAETLRFMEPAKRQASVERMFDLYYKERFQGLAVIVRDKDGAVVTYPKDLSVEPPPPGWGDVSGVVDSGERLYGWAHRATTDGSDITVTAPLSREYLAGLLPELGIVDLSRLVEETTETPKMGTRSKGRQLFRDDRSNARPALTLRPPMNRFDLDLQWYRLTPVYLWDKPSSAPTANALLQIDTRPSMVYDVLFTLKSDELQTLMPIILLSSAVAFLIVQMIALLIGISMTRTITGAVHDLYEGTQRVTAGDFKHRIPVHGEDQLAELGKSFNTMTGNVQHLLEVAKEKERLQGEIEIAREVQAQLYPKSVPSSDCFRLNALCQPARMVSGDYFDYDTLPRKYIGFALGDVAGKGISAALLMASLQSSVRSQWTYATENANFATEDTPGAPLSVSRVVSQVNQQLYKGTSPEKYATFFLGLYDPATSMLSYTNAGHLPPLLFRGDKVERLKIDGTVVGAFPFADYGESQQKLLPGDLVVCYTDGITEPENAYGEMFGEDRLIELIQRNLHKSDDAIVQAIVDTVLDWTGSPELQDDMTLLLARQM
ncbi:hypothetical protein F183_A34190 [Bryobacterales bacterium F-183]|nr:hypothetical protein F183_A34190 [Bryobacterales bacterium F-183]